MLRSLRLKVSLLLLAYGALVWLQANHGDARAVRAFNMEQFKSQDEAG